MIDVVIVNYKSTDYLLESLSSIYRSMDGIRPRIFVEDNESEPSIHRVAELFSGICLRRNRSNLGFAAAANQALIRSDSPYVVLLNPDCRIQYGFFNTVIDFMESHPDVGVLGPRILNRDGSVQGSARRFPNALTALFGRNSLLTRLFPNNPISRSNILSTKCDGHSPMDVDWVSGACMVVRREAIEAVGLLDEQFFMYWEDADWCRRMWQHGWKVVYLPTTVVAHDVGRSSAKAESRSILEFHKSAYRLFAKHHSQPSQQYLKGLVFFGLMARYLLVRTMRGGMRLYRGLPKRSTAGQERFKTKPPPLSVDRRETVDTSASVQEKMNDRAPAGTLPQRPIRVMRIIGRLNIGGPAIHVQILLEDMPADRFETIVLAGRISETEGDMAYIFNKGKNRIHYLPAMNREIDVWNDLRSIISIVKMMKRERPDIVHTHTAKAGFVGRIAAMVYRHACNRRVKVVHTFHGNVFHGYFNRTKTQVFIFIERLLARISDRVVVISPSQYDEITKVYHVSPEYKTRIIKLGFDLRSFFNTASDRRRLQRRWGASASIRRVGLIGRLVPIKNHAMYLRIILAYRRRFPNQDVRFLVVGDGELMTPLKIQCRQLGIADRVEFLGWQKQVSEIYADLDAVVLTSLNEGTPVSLIEAMAAGVPVIATPVGGVRDLLGKIREKHESGFSICDRGIRCPISADDAFVCGIDYLLNAEDSLTAQIIDRAQQFVRAEYAKSRLIRDMDAMYVELFSGRPPEASAIGG